MLRYTALLVCLALPALPQGGAPERLSFFAPAGFDNVYHVERAGNTDKVDQKLGSLVFDERTELRFAGKAGDEVRVPYRAVKRIVFEKASPYRHNQAESRWTRPFAFAKGVGHFLTIHYEGLAGRNESLWLRLDRQNWQEVVATIEAKTNLRVERVGPRSDW